MALWEGIPSVTGEFPSQSVSNTESIPMQWYHPEYALSYHGQYCIDWERIIRPQYHFHDGYSGGDDNKDKFTEYCIIQWIPVVHTAT